MQGIVYMPQNLETGSTPPHKGSGTNVNMDLTSADPNTATKEPSGHHQSARSDSGFLSATNNTTCSEEDGLNVMQHYENGDTDDRSDCSSPDRKYYCPICETMLTSQHEFTLHIRSHNNDAETQIQDKGFVCRICSKVLSSSSSLDRHVLVHSGERPFTCKYCGDTFTTNGNMHRHMRTHAFKNDYESDGSTDSSVSTGSRNIEFNNNKIDRCENKRQLEVSDGEHKNVRKKRDNDLLAENNAAQKIQCPVCERDDFNSLTTLDYHLEDNHPDYPTKCTQCSQIFKNNKILNIHRNTVHAAEENGKTCKNSVVGFKDLTFVDFSSEKFPHIARYECEKNLHRAATGLKFQCPKCSRAFPCASSLEIHRSNCCVGLDLSVNENLNLSKQSPISDSDIRRADFFSRLDLQDNSPEKPKTPPQASGTNKLHQRLLESAIKTMDCGKDLADIQSILSMTANGRLLQHLQENSDSNALQQNNPIELRQEKTEEEESQDSFAVEFRKMKLRGEFPCRLCTAVFPNLRALKGHNRAHLNGNSNGTYRCNMCPHSSIDKAALIRHMRTHNGDRPYECSLCNYAFTTKANCERHLRNRHAKTTREEVKKAIIYHPSEDPTNEDINKIAAREEAKKCGSSMTSPDSNEVSEEKNANVNLCPNSETLTETQPKQKDLSPLVPLTVQIQAWKHSLSLEKTPSRPIHNVNDLIHSENIKSLKEHGVAKDEPSPYLQPQFNFTPKIINTSTPQKPKIQVKNLEALKQVPCGEDDYGCDSFKDDEEPMNLVLDLSKKKADPVVEGVLEVEHEEIAQDLTKKLPNISPFNVTEILAQQLINNSPKIDHASLYPAAPFAFLRNGFPGLGLGLGTWSPFHAINPLLFQTIQPPTLSQDPQEIKRLQRQLCGGGMIGNFGERLGYSQHLNNNTGRALNAFKSDLKYNDGRYSTPNQIKTEDLKPLTLNIDQTFADMSKIQSPIVQAKSELLQSPNSVKMVIKNGVLMPKQKQRRYRTERPFSCEHCSARFTLRSNMERHIKQQHPQFWSQRQRSNIGNPGRKHQIIAPVKSSCDINIPAYDAQKAQEREEAKDNQISDKIKYAILAQHLRANQNYKSTTGIAKKEEDDDCALIIDEHEDKTDSNTMHGAKNRMFEENLNQFSKFDSFLPSGIVKNEEAQDLVPVSRLLDNASQQPFKEYFRGEGEEQEVEGISEEDEEGLVASGSTSEANSGSDENKSESEHAATQGPIKKKSAYSLAPNRVSCPYCSRKFPWTSSLRRHILTHTGQKPFKCSHCPLLFTTKSNCDRHLLRKHGNSATTISNDIANNNSNYLMRNVPERPFKCSSCPSSTFSTYSNLKKHMTCKHGAPTDDKAQGYEAGSSEDEKQNMQECKSDWEAQISHSKVLVSNSDGQNAPANSDLPFKCHLCEGSFGDRHDCLDHIKDKHPSEYDLLISKNALDNGASVPEEVSANHDDDENEIRGKFPDYSNRKVICAFCMRRFWSAEDLRRHMRTHTGERPFSCDICRRRFTLKHSMLRHRKKHNVRFDGDNVNSDEDNNVIPNLEKLKSNKLSDKTDESDGNEGNDLISNLLGIQDRSIIEQVLTSSPDDAAKLLGVKNGDQE